MPYVPALLQSGKTCAESSLVSVSGKMVGYAGQGAGCADDSLEWAKQTGAELVSFYTFLPNPSSSNSTYGYADAAAPIGWQGMGESGDAWATWTDEQCRKKFGDNGWRGMSIADASSTGWHGFDGTQQVDRWWRGELKYWNNGFLKANDIAAYGGSRQAVCIKPPGSTLEECKRHCSSDALCRERGFGFVPRSGNGTTLGDCRFPTAASKVSKTATTTAAALYRKPGCIYMKVPHYQYKTGHQARTLSFLECRLECDKQPGCPDKGFTWSDESSS